MIDRDVTRRAVVFSVSSFLRLQEGRGGLAFAFGLAFIMMALAKDLHMKL